MEIPVNRREFVLGAGALIVASSAVWANPAAPLYPDPFEPEGLAGVDIESVVTEGAVIAEVVPESSATRAGLLAGDVVTSIAGRPMAGLTRWEALAACRRPQNSTCWFEVNRSGKTLRFQLRWAPTPASILASSWTEAVRHGKAEGRIEKIADHRFGLLLDTPVGMNVPIGATVLVPLENPSIQFRQLVQGKVTRRVSPFRLEADALETQTQSSAQQQLWRRALVVLGS
jgi:hypothetical protein